jgi:tRNA U34 5-carboxymethylaminomethyl modifying enzyme MnmG/GidA
MTGHTPEEIKNRLSNLGEAIGLIALEYIIELEKENEQFKEYNEDLKQSLDWANERENEYVDRIEELKGSLESLNRGKK